MWLRPIEMIDGVRQTRRELLAIASLRAQRAAMALGRATEVGRKLEQALAGHRKALEDWEARKEDAARDYVNRIGRGELPAPMLAAFVASAQEHQEREREAMAETQARWRDNQVLLEQAVRCLQAQEERAALHRQALRELDEAESDARDEDAAEAAAHRRASRETDMR